MMQKPTYRGGRLAFVAIPYEAYERGVIDADVQALNEYGCKGFNDNWADGCSAFFIGKLLSVMCS